MGAQFCDYRIKAKTKIDAVKQAEDYQRQCQYEDGHGGYTGHLGTAGVGVQVPHQTFADMESAEKWAVDTHDKWDAPYLIKVGTGDDWLLCGWCSS